ncbi:AbiEi antitoxin N-terminal domain-containing protein, partial [Candidatus Bipolaricaulota bacterium]|nr:AbiEi antitoxin N-terminal domain-containing protein [Candidatus Bipolaricaulota bacterium]
MTRTSGSKINRLLQNWPHGTVATQRWLDTQGVTSKLANWHVGSGWLTRFGPRAFLQPGDTVDWRGGLYALQSQLQMTVHVGARIALELRGLSHFVPLGPEPSVTLISDRP